MERLQKVLAHANVASRRESEKLILEGRVKINGQVTKEMGVKVLKNDIVTVDNEPILRAEKQYFLMNKPTGYITSSKDDKNRKTVLDLLHFEDKINRIYPIGRLDYDTAGLLLLTNDGALTHILTKPEFDVEKEYLARVKGIVIKEKIRQLRKGILIDKTYLAIPKSVHIVELDKTNQTTLIQIVLTEGKNKQVRKMMKAMGHEVLKLTRVRYDFLTLEGVERGEYRPLTTHEIKKLYANRFVKKTKKS